jgi:signal transduction histidine kinase
MTAAVQVAAARAKSAGRGAAVSRVVPSVLLVAAVAACGLAVPGSASALRHACAQPDCSAAVTVPLGVDVVLAAAWVAASALVLLLGPVTRVNRVLGVVLLAQCLTTTVQPALTEAQHDLAARTIGAGTLSLAMLGIAVFPDGRFVPGWIRWAVGGFALWQLASAVAGSDTGVLGLVEGLVYFAMLAVVVGAQIYRYRRVSGPLQRRQANWLVYGLAVMLVASLLVSLPYFAPGRFPGLVAPGSAYDQLQTLVSGLALLIIPTCVTIAILRAGLFDIEVLAGRTLVYAGLSLMVALAYLTVVAGVGALVSAGAADRILPLFAAALVSVLFQPLRAWLQSRVRRWLYGLRGEPYEAVNELGRRLAATLPDEDVPARVVATVREALRVPYVALALRQADGYPVTEQSGTRTARQLTLPLVHQGEQVGLLLVDEDPGEPLSSAGRELLADLARHAGAAIQSVRLTASLRASAEQLQAARERLVLAGEEERRRLRRDLHDELAPTLAAARLTAGTAADLLVSDPGAAGRVLDRLQVGLQSALGDIQRIVDELRPIALDERGLIAALQERAEALRSTVRVQLRVNAPVPLQALPAAVELAAYRICQEGLMNVLKHSRADTCSVSLRVAGEDLTLEIQDDGIGMTADQPGRPTRDRGVGIPSMRERAAELGGVCTITGAPGTGTRVTVRLPLHTGRVG